ncbi:Fic family protein [Acidithiobacillus sp. MC6.1]|nr:Fic family protein [Acidithiobacillus sp. MC6.1]
MFDPFNDFDSAGYLRNIRKDKDASIIKHFEHNLFRANLDNALDFLSGRRFLTYQNFLEVHRKLFSDYYPWAGQDRSVTLQDRAVMKGDVFFCHPEDTRRAVEQGLRIGQDKHLMNKKPGEVMGLFAYGHPFLDGNGRTMLLVHLELSYRAGFSIAWADTSKVDYLDALGKEIERPGKGILDDYLLQFKGKRLDRDKWADGILSISGLDGLDEDNQIDGSLTDPVITEKYRKFESQRGYSYKAMSTFNKNRSKDHGMER